MKLFDIHLDWRRILASSLGGDVLASIEADILSEKSGGITVYPKQDDIFRAINMIGISDIRVVILGQDPYHGEGQAHGLSFSVPRGIAIPPSLRNIYKELHDDVGIAHPGHGDLSSWAEQGVLLLNSVLTVRAGEPGSHSKIGWEEVTGAIISEISRRRAHVVFVLWGGYAQKKIQLIDTTKHIVIQAPHPSPLSSYRGFFGSKPFSTINTALTLHDIPPINWDSISL